jgi:hypothetical protein
MLLVIFHSLAGGCRGARCGSSSFFATIKTEIGVDIWPDRASARRDIEIWITSYNEQQRLRSSLGHRTPTQMRPDADCLAGTDPRT